LVTAWAGQNLYVEPFGVSPHGVSQFSPADSLGESRVVIDALRGACLATHSAAFDNQSFDTFSGSVEGS
jgi:hypothetical protein